jgi:hypothetical protein
MEIMKYLRAQWDRAIGVGALVIGVVALVLGYFGVSNTPHVAAQLPYFISGGLFGIFMLGVACMTWLSADLRDEWRELRAIRQLLEPDTDDNTGIHRAGKNGSGAQESGTHPDARIQESRERSADAPAFAGAFNDATSRGGASPR